MKELIYDSKPISIFHAKYREWKFQLVKQFHKITRVGVHSTNVPEYNVRLKFINWVSFLIPFVSFFFLFYSFSSKTQLFIFSFVQISLSFLFFYFQYNRKYIPAKSILFLQVESFVIALNLLHNSSDGWIYYYIPIFLLNFLLFCPVERKYSYIFSVLNLYLIVSTAYFSDSFVYLKPNFDNHFYKFNFFLGIALLIGSIILLVKRAEFTLNPESQTMEFKKLLQEEVLQRQKAEELWSDALQMQAEIMNAIPSDVLILNSEGSIVRLNQIKEPFFKESIEQIPHFGVGSNFLELASLIYKNCSLPVSSLLHATGQILFGNETYWELDFNTSFHSKIDWYKLKISKIEYNSFKGAFVMLVNFTQQKESMEATRKMNRMSSIMKALNTDLMFHMDIMGNVFDCISEPNFFPTDFDLPENKNTIRDFGFPESVVEEILETAKRALKYGSYYIFSFQLPTIEKLALQVKMVAVEEGTVFLVLKKDTMEPKLADNLSQA
jgi:hypothetical protein